MKLRQRNLNSEERQDYECSYADSEDNLCWESADYVLEVIRGSHLLPWAYEYACEKHLQVIIEKAKENGHELEGPILKVLRKEMPDDFDISTCANFTCEDWTTFIAEHNLKRLGSGVYREVYALTSKLVVKLNHTRSPDRNGCESEVERWSKSEPEVKQVLAEVKLSGSGWLIMERAVETCMRLGMSGEAFKTISRDLRDITGYHDLHAGNVAYFGRGVFKIIDYAI